MKKLLAVILALIILLPCFCANTFAEGIIEVVVDGTQVEFDAAPFIDENNRTLVPIRALCVALGIADENVAFSDGVVTIKGEAKGESCTISLTIGSNVAMVNGVGEVLDTAAQIVNDRTFVPLRFVTETFDCHVLFYGASAMYPNRSLIDIKSPAYTKFVVYTTQTAVNDEHVGKILEIAAAITGIHQVDCIIGENDTFVEKLNLMQASGQMDILMDTGFLTDEKLKELTDAGRFAKLDEAIALYAPTALEWINSDSELKSKVCDSRGNIIAFPVKRNGKIDRFYISAFSNVNKAVSLIHGFREVISSMEAAPTNN